MGALALLDSLKLGLAALRALPMRVEALQQAVGRIELRQYVMSNPQIYASMNSKYIRNGAKTESFNIC